MNSTRLTSVAVLIAVSIGLAFLAVGESWTLVTIGAFLVAGGAIALARHFWREADRRLRRDSAALVRTVISEVHSMQEAHESQTKSLERQLEDLSGRSDAFARGVLEYAAQLELDAREEQELIQKRFDSTERLALRYRDDVLMQLSGVISVYSILRPAIPYPPFGGWAISGDCAQRLVSLILRKKPRWVLELGSGLSTILASQALELAGGEGQVISLEHEFQWLERSRAMVSDYGLTHRSQIVHTPLVETDISGDTYKWYDLSQMQFPEEVGVIFVDGPPMATGPMARYPALPLLHDRLAVDGVLLMDDAHRTDEQAAIEEWKAEFPDLTFHHHSDSKGTVEVIKGKE